MNEPVTVEIMDAGTRLVREVGVMAGRLAHFLGATMRGQERAVSESQTFLWAMFESISEGRPLESWLRNRFERAPSIETGVNDPLDRLAQSLRFTPREVELLLISGMSEEHEGL